MQVCIFPFKLKLELLEIVLEDTCIERILYLDRGLALREMLMLHYGKFP